MLYFRRNPYTIIYANDKRIAKYAKNNYVNSNNKIYDYTKLIEENKRLNEKNKRLYEENKRLYEENNRLKKSIIMKHNLSIKARNYIKSVFHMASMLFSPFHDDFNICIYGGFFRRLFDYALHGDPNIILKGDVDIMANRNCLKRIIKIFENLKWLVEKDGANDNDCYEHYRKPLGNYYFYSFQLSVPHESYYVKINIDLTPYRSNPDVDFNVNNICLKKDGIGIFSENKEYHNLYNNSTEQLIDIIKDIYHKKARYGPAFEYPHDESDDKRFHQHTKRKQMVRIYMRSLKIFNNGYMIKRFENFDKLIKKLICQNYPNMCIFCHKIVDLYTHDDFVVLNCYHIFHINCIYKNIKINIDDNPQYTNRCHICRQPFLIRLKP